MTLKGGEWQEDQLGAGGVVSGPKEQHSGEFPGYPFCLSCLRLGTERASHLAMQMDSDKNSHNESLLSLAKKKKTEKVQSKEKPFRK